MTPREQFDEIIKGAFIDLADLRFNNAAIGTPFIQGFILGNARLAVTIGLITEAERSDIEDRVYQRGAYKVATRD